MEILRRPNPPFPKSTYPGEVYLTAEALEHAGSEARKLRIQGTLAAASGIIPIVGTLLSYRFHAPHDVTLGFALPSVMGVGFGAASPGWFMQANAVAHPKDNEERGIQFDRLKRYGTGYRFVWPESLVESIKKSAVIFSKEKNMD